jgi:hypothetical protein
MEGTCAEQMEGAKCVSRGSECTYACMYSVCVGWSMTGKGGCAESDHTLLEGVLERESQRVCLGTACATLLYAV